MSKPPPPCDTEICRDIERYSGLSAADSVTVSDIASIYEIQGNIDLITAFEPADDLYILLKGRLSLAMPVPGRSHDDSVVTTVSTGELLGWEALLPDRVWQISARSLKPCQLIRIPGSELRELCEQNTGIGFQLSKRALDIAGQRLAACRLQILDIFGQADD